MSKKRLASVPVNPNAVVKTTRGKRPSSKDLLESHYKKSIWDVLDSLDVKDPESALQMIEKETSGAVSFSVPTLKKIVEQGIESGEVTKSKPYAVWFEKKADKKRASTREIIERHYSMDVWKVLDKFKADNPSLMISLITKDTNGEITFTEPTLKKMISEGLENEEIDSSKPYASWVARKRKSKSEVANDNAQVNSGLPTTMATAVCTGCGHSKPKAISFFGGGIGIRAMRCDKCQKFATLKVTGKKDGVSFSKVCREKNGITCEIFVDENDKEIENHPIESKRPNPKETVTA